jgi:5-methylcytosine-specific restriction endonuclease McrA
MVVKMKLYNKLKEEFLTKNTKCLVCTKANAVDVHHVAGRYGKGLTDVNNFLPVCRQCHNWIHENGKEARELGFRK